MENAFGPVDPIAVRIHLPDAQAGAVFRQFQDAGVQRRALAWSDLRGLVGGGVGFRQGTSDVDGEKVTNRMARYVYDLCKKMTVQDIF
jgi:hypothetical protein